MSWFSSKTDAAVQNFYPVTTYDKGYSALTDKDTEWGCATNKGFRTETQVWYSVLGDGSLILCQVIWSYAGIMLIPATSQFCFKYYNAKTKKVTWRSIGGSSFKPNGRGCKANEWEIKHEGNAAGTETYTISSSTDKNVQVNLSFTRPAEAPGFKFGAGGSEGYSTFGKSREEGKSDGIVVHRFHPVSNTSGLVIIDGEVIDVKGNGMFVHAIQGMRPDSLASRWNFAFFTTGGEQEESKLGTVRAIQMELETTDAYGPNGPNSGRTKVNIGTVFISSKNPVPVLAVGQTHVAGSATYPEAGKIAPGDVSSFEHLSTVKDAFTGYAAPTGMEVKWAGERRDGQGRASAKLVVDKLGATEGEGGLIEKVDVLAEIPYVIKKALSAVTGTKPYIYQYLNPATLEVEIDGETVPVKGYVFNEASFVSA